MPRLTWLKSIALAWIERSDKKVGFVGGSLIGMFPWPHDPFYRPLVGIVCSGRLVSVAPTFRHRPSKAGRMWPCVFDVDVKSLALSKQDFDVICLETGLSIVDTSAQRRSAEGDLLRIEDIIALAEGSQPSWDCSGFCWFLMLSIQDQIDLLYNTVLFRAADDSALKYHTQDIIERRVTILDVRDKLIATEEFRNVMIKLNPTRLTHWVVWGGLTDIACADACCFKGAAELNSQLDAWRARITLDGPDLANLALGMGHGSALRSRWETDHLSAIADLHRRSGASA